MKGKPRLSGFPPAILGAILGLLCVAVPVRAATATSYYTVNIPGTSDYFVNYDHLSTNLGAGNTDWPINLVPLVLLQNADINKAKNILQPQFNNTGGVMYTYLKDGSSWVWDSDRGMKNPSGSCPINVHARMYADGDDRMYNTLYGYYIIASSHWDELENCSGEWFGASENAENAIRNEYAVRGYVTWSNYTNVGNPEAPRWEGNHYWENSGYWTEVIIP